MDELREFLVEGIPYWETLGLKLVEAEPGHAVFEAEVGQRHMQNGVVHGGVLASMADSACAVAAIAKVYPANYATTINLQVSYLKPLIEGRFRAVGRCIKAGKSVLFCEAKVFDSKDILICTAVSQLMVIARGK
jgi:uncharacterized protein (TIGR00369 family)